VTQSHVSERKAAWVSHGRLVSSENARAIQLASMPVIPGQIQPRSVWLPALLTLATFGLYGLQWFRSLQRELDCALARNSKATGHTLLAFVTCALAAFPVLFAMQHEARVLSGKAAKSSSYFLGLALLSMLVPLSGFIAALLDVQQALNTLEARAKEAHGHRADG
jgi:hypothetical protein